MSQINISSLLSGSPGAVDGGQLRSAAGSGLSNGKDSAVGDFASLIAGRLAQQSGSLGQTNASAQAAGANAAQATLLKAQPVDMAGVQLRQAVAALEGHGQSAQTAAAGTVQATQAVKGETLGDVISQIRQLLAKYRPQIDSHAMADSGTQAASGAVGQGFSQLAQSLNKLLDRLGLSVDGVQAEAVASGTGVAAGGSASIADGLKQFSQLVTSLQNALERLSQKIEQSGGDGSLASALLQQVQIQLQQLADKAAHLQQQTSSLTQGSLDTLLKGLDAALARLQRGGVATGQSATAGAQPLSTAQQILAERTSAKSNGNSSQSESTQVTSQAATKSTSSTSVSHADMKSSDAASSDQPAWLTALLKQRVAVAKAATQATAHGATQGGNGQSLQNAVATSGTHAIAVASSQLPNVAQWLLSQPKGGSKVAVDPTSTLSAATDTTAAGATYSAAGLVTNAQLSGVLGGSGTTQQVNPQLAANVGQQISWMVGKSISSASINVSPADLGPLKIHVQMQQDGGLQVQLLAHQHVTRDALEQSLPRLREWLQEAGLGNAQVSVGADASGGGFAQMANGSPNEQGGAANGGSSDSAAGTETASLVNGNDAPIDGLIAATQGPLMLLDLFA